MSTDFTLPELGENITAGDVLRLLVKPGDTLAKDQPVLELETDKATIEVPSSVAGQVKDIKVKAGDKVKVGQAILTVEDGAAAKEQAPKPADEKAQEKIPKEGALEQHVEGKRPTPVDKPGVIDQDQQQPDTKGRPAVPGAAERARRRSSTSAVRVRRRKPRRRRRRLRRRLRPRSAAWLASWASTSPTSRAPAKLAAFQSRM